MKKRKDAARRRKFASAGNEKMADRLDVIERMLSVLDSRLAVLHPFVFYPGPATELSGLHTQKDSCLIDSMILSAAEKIKNKRPEEGSRHQEWRSRLNDALRTRLRERGFHDEFIEDFIARNVVLLLISGPAGPLGYSLYELWQLWRAIERAQEDAGEEPAWDE